MLQVALAADFGSLKTQHFPLPKTKPGNNSNRKPVSLAQTLHYFEATDLIHAEIDP